MKDLFTLVLSVTMLMLSATRISAQPWPTLPDGSLVLTIQGDRVILPAPMLQHPNRVTFDKIPTIAFSGGGTNLENVIANPDRFRPLLDNNIGGVSVSFNIGQLWGRDPDQEADADLIRQQLWLGAFGIGTQYDTHGMSREMWQNRLCERSSMGEGWYEFRNFSHVLREGARTGNERRVFQICAGQFLISYTVPVRWFPRERLPELHDRLVAFFAAMLPDSRLEVFP